MISYSTPTSTVAVVPSMTLKPKDVCVCVCEDTDLILGGSAVVTNESSATGAAPQAAVRGMTPFTLSLHSSSHAFSPLRRLIHPSPPSLQHLLP